MSTELRYINVRLKTPPRNEEWWLSSLLSGGFIMSQTRRDAHAFGNHGDAKDATIAFIKRFPAKKYDLSDFEVVVVNITESVMGFVSGS